jgi:hypothetical protein
LNRSGERLVIVGLIACMILLITVPAIGDFLRYMLACRMQDPLNDEDDEAIVSTSHPRHAEVMGKYGQHVDEMLRQYRRDLLPDVVQVRGALQEVGISDSQFERVYTNPKKYEDIEAIAERLWDMAGRLDRRTKYE